MIFGTRQIANTEQHGGLMLAVAFESFVKLFALLCVALFFVFAAPENIHQISKMIVETFHQVYNSLVCRIHFDSNLVGWTHFRDHLFYRVSSTLLWSNCVMKNIFVGHGAGLQFI